MKRIPAKNVFQGEHEKHDHELEERIKELEDEEEALAAGGSARAAIESYEAPDEPEESYEAPDEPEEMEEVEL